MSRKVTADLDEALKTVLTEWAKQIGEQRDPSMVKTVLYSYTEPVPSPVKDDPRAWVMTDFVLELKRRLFLAGMIAHPAAGCTVGSPGYIATPNSGRRYDVNCECVAYIGAGVRLYECLGSWIPLYNDAESTLRRGTRLKTALIPLLRARGEIVSGDAE